MESQHRRAQGRSLLLFCASRFLGGEAYTIAGIVLGGLGLGAQEAIMSAAVEGMVSADRRGTAFATFNTGFAM